MSRCQRHARPIPLSSVGAQEPELVFEPLLEDRFVLACRQDHDPASLRHVERPQLEPYHFITVLGLSMVHGLAAQPGGGLTIDSALGRGTTTIDLWLPISAGPIVGRRGQWRRRPLRPVAAPRCSSTTRSSSA